MFLIDDILLAPIHGVIWLARKLHNAAQEELLSEGEAIKTKLSELYMMLETGRITESEFTAREKDLLDKLDEFESRKF
ncbi:MAG: gas vesicle protein GvpG [Candidatus Hatepunaea meridiana]|nr:gas vesicle protein GvpG [Candidatus Hatepunaea meridiana]